jgi:hypothetical protein
MKQYIGDSTKMLVHNSLNKQEACGVNEIPEESKKEFDALYQATSEGFSKCPTCIGDSIW